jgi:hypothetical protein
VLLFGEEKRHRPRGRGRGLRRERLGRRRGERQQPRDGVGRLGQEPRKVLRRPVAGQFRHESRPGGRVVAAFEAVQCRQEHEGVLVAHVPHVAPRVRVPELPQRLGPVVAVEDLVKRLRIGIGRVCRIQPIMRVHA